jgi:hypothetical protein
MIPEQAVIDLYLTRLGGQLRGSRRYRREMLAEIRAHLTDLAEASGCSSADALCRFGDADEIASQLNRVRQEKRRRDLRRVTTGVASAAAAAIAAICVPSHDRLAQGPRSPVSALRQPLAVTLDPVGGDIVSEEPLSAATVH